MSRSNRQSGSDSVPFLGERDRAGSRGSSSSSSRQTINNGNRSQQLAGRNRQAEMAAAFGDQDDEEEEGDNQLSSLDGQMRGVQGPLAGSSGTSPPAYGFHSVSSSHDAGTDGQIGSHDDVFFDAGDALASDADPLGASAMNSASENMSTTATIRHGQSNAGLRQDTNDDGLTTPRANGSGSSNSVNGVNGGSGYDFEQASYFAQRPASNNNSRRSLPSALSRSNSESHNLASGDVSISMSEADGGLAMGGGGGAGSSRHFGPMASSAHLAGLDATGLSRARLLLGRFGRFVGMRVPGATYASLSTQDDTAQAASRRRVMGSGINQDGVFANLNAKPERRRRRGDGDDRGDDDDLVDEVLPPTYETAAADTAPPYWETTIIGGPGGLHPLAPGGMGWTPGGAHVGAIEDLIVDGLPVGNFFGFAWNLLVSMSFQFVGFLLTYLLHTTHAARCGSRAGLGITLVQYGFYLRTRAIQIVDGKLPDDGLSGLPGDSIGSQGGQGGDDGSWWIYPHQPSDDSDSSGSKAARSLLSRGLSLLARQLTETATTSGSGVNGTMTMADALANDTNPAVTNAQDVGASTEWLAYILMALGWFILFSSLLSYWRVHRWGKQLVDAARRDAESSSHNASGEETGTTEPSGSSSAGTGGRDPNAPIGFMHTLRAAFERSRRNSSLAGTPRGSTDPRGAAGASGGTGNGRGHSAEDWVIFPGMTAAGSASRSRLLFGGVGAFSAGGGVGRGGRRRSDLEVGEAEANRTTSEDDDDDDDGSDTDDDSRRLVRDLRTVGLIA